MKQGSFLGVVTCALLVVAQAVHAQLPTTQLTSIFPPGGKQGTAVEVTVAGNDMDDIDRLAFNHLGLTAAAKMTAATDLEPARPMPGQFTVTIAGDVPPGVYEARVQGRFGLSNPRPFSVGVQGEIVDNGGNTSPDKAVDVAVGSTVSGRVDANAYDFFRLNLKQGERVVINLVADRIDSRLDGTLVLLSPSGRELTRVKDGVATDPVLDFTAPAEGAYLLRLSDAVYGGGADYFYRLTVSAAPFVDFVFPPAGPAGSNNQYTIYGRNLPGGQPADGLLLGGAPLQKVQVNIAIPGDDAGQSRLPLGELAQPRQAWLDGVEFRLPTPAGPANPVAVYVAKAAVALEQEPNNEAKAATKVTLPCEIAGQFYPQRDLDWFQFDAKKGEIYFVEAISNQLGLESDPALAIFRVTKNDKGEEQLAEIVQVDDADTRGGGQRRGDGNPGGEFDASHDDPATKFTVPEDGTYRLMLRDQFGDGRQNPAYVYRLAIRPAAPDFRLLAYATVPRNQQQDNQMPLAAPAIRKGGTLAFTLAVQRRDDFDGEIAVSVEGLPAGVTCPGAVLGGDVSRGALVIVAVDSAAAWAGPIKVVGKSKIGDREVVREARYGLIVWGSQNRQQQPPTFRLAGGMQLGVIDKETDPALVQIGEDKVWETSLGGKLEIPVTVTRRGDFKDAIKLTAAGLPQQIRPKELNVDGNKGDGKFELELNQQNTPLGVYTFYVRGETKWKYPRNPDAIMQAEAEQKRVAEMIKTIEGDVKNATAAKDQVTKAAADAAAAAKTGEQKKTEAANNAKAKADAAKQATDKLAQAKEAAAKDTANAGLAEAAKVAETAANDAAAAQKKADEELAAADKALTDAQAAAKKADEAKVAGEAALKTVTDKQNQANQLKQTADKRVNDTKQQNQPKDVQFALASTPVKLRIHSHPFKVTATPPGGPVKQGEKQELPVKVERLFGFADSVELTLEPPQGVQGLAAEKVTLNKDQGDGKLQVAAAANATPGQHNCTLRVRGRFNNIQVDSTTPVTVAVEEVKK